uniref:ubiquitinyl hydrolase 1 n=1 Tax=Xiphophorus maculatus TaxID=8083 RepID=M4A2R3_XIPMA
MQKGLKKYFVNMDEYLSSLGLYRKMVARDASSLFRAVSEQLYFSQNYHQKIRLDCASFMRANRCNFEPFVEGSFEKYLERLEDPKETVGQVEIKALSQLYRRCFLIYRYPGKPATVISENDFEDKVTLCCSINGHYDIIYGRSYPASAALCQSLLYELLYTQVFGVEGVELWQAMETFRAGGRRYRNSLSVCSDVDVGYDAPEDRLHRDEAEPPAEAPPTSRLCLPYKVLKSLDGDVYRNLEFDVWQDTCKEMQKTDYMVFAGRQYFLGDKCQVRLEPKGKFYNAFIQEVGTHSTAVTVFIEELGEKHLVPLTDLKPVNPVPAWNVAAPPRKGDPADPESRGQRHHRHRYFRKSRGSSGAKGAELLLPPPVSYGGPALSPLPPRFQPAGHPRPPLPPSPGLIGPQLTYYHPGRRYYHDYENYAFRSRRSRRHLLAVSKECQFGFPAEAVEEAADLDPPMTFYQLEDAGDAVFPPLQVSSSYRVQRATASRPPASPPDATPPCSSEDDQADASTVEDQGEWQTFQNKSLGERSSTRRSTCSAPRVRIGTLLPCFLLGQEVTSCCVVDQSYQMPGVYPTDEPAATQVTTLTPDLIGFLSSVSMMISAAAPWLVSESGEPLCTVLAPPSYSYDPSGSDLPRDCRVVQYYYNLGVQVGPAPSAEGPASIMTPASPGSAPSGLLYPDQTALPAPTLLHLPFEAPPPAGYLPAAPHPPLPHLPHSSYHPCVPPSAHWGALSTSGHAPRVYCPAPSPHVVGYITAPHPHHTPTHYVPPSM